MRLRLGLEGPDTAAIVRALVHDGLPFAASPRVGQAGYAPLPVDWLGALADGPGGGWAEWDDAELAHHPGGVVHATLEFPGDPDRVLALLERLPFTVASTGTLFPEWDDMGYHGPGLGDGHGRHGWAAAFKGSGHQRLVSRRWLGQDLWKVRAGASDTTLVQFHDLGLDARAALIQARPGHERMGFSARGGYLPPSYRPTVALRGIAEPGGNLLRVIVHGRDVPQAELLDASSLRRAGAASQIAYVFMEEAPARRHLPELWLRELQCWAVVGGEERRLDGRDPPLPAGG